MSRLSPFLGDGNDMMQTALLVGSEGTGKHKIAQSLVEMAVSIRLKIHTCTTLPLHDDSPVYNTSVPFICFVVHSNNKDSYKTLLHCIGKVDVSYFLGRSAIVVNTAGLHTEDLEFFSQVLQIGNQYGIQVFSMDVENDAERAELGRTLMMMIETAQGHRRNFTPLLFDSVQKETLTNGDRTSDRTITT